MSTSLSFCAVLWCAFSFGVPDDPVLGISVARDVYATNEVVDHLAIGEVSRVFGGLAWMGDRHAGIVGALPLRASFGRLALNAGVSVATSAVPLRGTRANWVARGDVLLSKRVAVQWWHVSNGTGASGHNPSLDALALSWTF